MTHTLSSAAERTYWLGRYLERAESTARLINTNGQLLFDLPQRLPLGWVHLVETMGSDVLFRELYESPDERSVARFLINDQRNPGSLLSSVNQARENVRTLRGIIPRQTVEYVNDLHLYSKDKLSEPLSRTRRTEGLYEVTKFTQRIEGFMSANMLHDAHWTFFRLGNYIERADMTSRIMDTGLDNVFGDAEKLEPYADIQWRSVLRSLDAFQSYNTEVQEPVAQAGVFDFLAKNERLPRSLAYALGAMRRGLRSLPHHETTLRKVNRLRRLVTSQDFDAMDAEQARTYLDDFQLELAKVNQSIQRAYFRFTARRKADRPSKT